MAQREDYTALNWAGGEYIYSIKFADEIFKIKNLGREDLLKENTGKNMHGS
jgi:hypothetical protein